LLNSARLLIKISFHYASNIAMENDSSDERCLIFDACFAAFNL